MSSQSKQRHNARIITTSQQMLAEELSRIGAELAGQQIMWNKALIVPIKLDGLTCVGANVLKQEMLARGGDCAVHRDCVTLKRERTSVLLLGSPAQYDDLIPKLGEQGFGLPEVAYELAGVLANWDRVPLPMKLGPFTLPVGQRTLVMGIINVTPDSFSGDSLGDNVDAAVEQALRMQSEGADILDVGGQSTRPGSEPVGVEEEIHRVVPVLKRVVESGAVALPISVDTSRAAVAEAALAAGAQIINDITGLRDEPDLARVVAEHDAGLTLMHIQGVPRSMQEHPHYDDLLGEVSAYLRKGIEKALRAGVKKDNIWIDPGIGFGKTVEHNLELLRRLRELRSLGCPILVGTSRKGFLGRILAEINGGSPPSPTDRVVATGATVALAIANGADAVRVHDVAHNVQVARVADAVVRSA